MGWTSLVGLVAEYLGPNGISPVCWVEHAERLACRALLSKSMDLFVEWRKRAERCWDAEWGVDAEWKDTPSRGNAEHRTCRAKDMPSTGCAEQRVCLVKGRPSGGSAEWNAEGLVPSANLDGRTFFSAEYNPWLPNVQTCWVLICAEYDPACRMTGSRTFLVRRTFLVPSAPICRAFHNCRTIYNIERFSMPSVLLTSNALDCQNMSTASNPYILRPFLVRILSNANDNFFNCRLVTGPRCRLTLIK